MRGNKIKYKSRGENDERKIFDKERHYKGKFLRKKI